MDTAFAPTPDQEAEGTLCLADLISLELLDPTAAAARKRDILHQMAIVCQEDEDPLAAWMRAMHADNPGRPIMPEDLFNNPDMPEELLLFLYILLPPAVAPEGETP